MTRSASPGSAAPGRTRTRSTAGSASSGSRSSKLAICGRIGTAMRMRAPGLAGRSAWSASASSAGNSRASGKNGTRPSGSHPVAPRDPRHAVREQCRIAAELVDQKTADQRRIFRIDHHLGADEACDHAAAVDVADEHDRHAGRARKPHIGDVVWPQVHLRGAAGAFDQHEIGLVPQTGEAVEHEPHQLGLHVLIGGGLGGRVDAALHHDLRADLALRLEQHRIHMHARRRARRARLQRLGAADLAAVRRHRGVVRHVLRLERPHREAAIGQRARQAGDDQRLADVGAGALEHQRARRHGQNSMPGCAFTPAAKWCFTSVISVTRSAASISSGLALRPVTTTCRALRRAASAATTCARSR